MADWTDGYVADLGYTFGYYRELQPLRAKLALLNAGWAFPVVRTACDLGFGQGVSINIHAAASPLSWYGTDFNPTQAAFAQGLAASSGAEARLFDQSFAEFCSRSDLPDFDYVGLHGIWSWISPGNHAVIVDFLRRKLKPGGILYIGYNTLPGWAPAAPMRHLLAEHAATMTAPATGRVPQIEAALTFAERLMGTNPAYGRANPAMADWIATQKGMDRHYLAHEFFNRNWISVYFAEMAEALRPAKLDYACSAYYFNHLDAINLTAEQLAFLAEIPDAMFRQTVRDFMVNERFRRDYWIKGPTRLSPLDRTDRLRQVRLMLGRPRSTIAFKAKGAAGEVSLREDVYGPILDVLADHRPRTIGEIERAVAGKGLSLATVVEAAVMLSGTDEVIPAQDDADIERARPVAAKLNAHLTDLARGSGDVPFLASPVSGGGLWVGQVPQLFLAARRKGRKDPADWAAYAWEIISTQGNTITKEGRPLQTAEENLAELVAEARKFAETALPLLTAAGIA